MLAKFETLTIMFMSILLEALPYLLLGALISSIIEEFVPSSFFTKIIPKNPFLASLVGCVMGFFLPCCDCAVIPVARGLMKKGVKQNVATSFMLASPIINPVVLLATINAFKSINTQMIYLRIIIGVVVSILAGVIVHFITKGVSFSGGSSKQREDNSVAYASNEAVCDCGDASCSLGSDDDCGCGFSHHDIPKDAFSRILSVLRHAVVDFIDIGKYLVIGAVMAASVQIFVPFNIMSSLSKLPIVSITLMAFVAYLLSLCSTSDAFVARSFVGLMSNSSILAFLVISPMLSVKSTIVLAGNFSRRYTWAVNLAVFILVVIACVLTNLFVF